ncbi:AraC family ligand binding domain-containing protein [Nocardioides hungaricus]
MRGANGRGFSAVVARTSTAHTPTGPRAFDYAEVTVIRSGAAILFGGFGHRHLHVGDVILLAPCTLHGMEPEGWITATTLYLDRDFLVDQVFWQYAAEFTDRFDAQRFIDTHFADPAHVLRLGQDRAGLLMPWLDELVALSIDGPPPERYYRAQSLLFAVFDVLAPHLAITDTAGPRGVRQCDRPRRDTGRSRPYATKHAKPPRYCALRCTNGGPWTDSQKPCICPRRKSAGCSPRPSGRLRSRT